MVSLFFYICVHTKLKVRVQRMTYYCDFQLIYCFSTISLLLASGKVYIFLAESRLSVYFLINISQSHLHSSCFLPYYCNFSPNHRFSTISRLLASGKVYIFLAESRLSVYFLFNISQSHIHNSCLLPYYYYFSPNYRLSAISLSLASGKVYIFLAESRLSVYFTDGTFPLLLQSCCCFPCCYPSRNLGAKTCFLVKKVTVTHRMMSNPRFGVLNNDFLINLRLYRLSAWRSLKILSYDHT